MAELTHYQKYKDTIKKYQAKHKEEIALNYSTRNKVKMDIREKEIALR